MTDRQVAVLMQRRMEGKTQETTAAMAISLAMAVCPHAPSFSFGEAAECAPTAAVFSFCPNDASMLMMAKGLVGTPRPVLPHVRTSP